jgi:hypothetical protein
VPLVEILADEGAKFGDAFAELERAAHVNDEDASGDAGYGPELHRERSFSWDL